MAEIHLVDGSGEKWQIIITYDDGEQIIGYARTLHKIGQTITNMINNNQSDNYFRNVQSIEIT